MLLGRLQNLIRGFKPVHALFAVAALVLLGGGLAVVGMFNSSETAVSAADERSEPSISTRGSADAVPESVSVVETSDEDDTKAEPLGQALAQTGEKEPEPETTSPPPTDPPPTDPPPTDPPPADPPPAAEPAPAGGPSAEAWALLRNCEASGRYDAVNPAGPYYGAYQFNQGTWNSVATSAGRADLVGVVPSQAAPADQDAMALALYNDRGAQPWPSCGRFLL